MSLNSTPRRSDAFGTGMTSLAAGALGLNLLAIAALLALVGVRGLGHFWQGELVQLTLADGTAVLGEVWTTEPTGNGDEERLRLRLGNRDLYGLDFRWVDESSVSRSELPENAALIERTEWGAFMGFARALRSDTGVVTGEDAVWEAFPAEFERIGEERDRILALREDGLAGLSHRMEALRLEKRRVELAGDGRSPDAIDAELGELRNRYETLRIDVQAQERALLSQTLSVESVDGRSLDIPIANVVRAVRPNALSASARVALYASRLWEFVADDPRESNTEGGIFPAIYGTVMMVFLTSIAVMPLGILGAVYLREYARNGVFTRVVRIAVNSLAGVPSIVFGVFGLGFFVYVVGGSLDALLYPERLPAPTFGTGGIFWASLTLALLTVPVVIVSAEEGIAAVGSLVREGSLALGATRFETLWRVVLPGAAPGVLTGLILAMGRAAGEVAPLMMVGMVKLAPSLPVDANFPYVHLERKFMHLGFHIYDVGFQSPNVEAVQPLVFATALLLIVVVFATNLTAIVLRNRLRRRYALGAV